MNTSKKIKRRGFVMTGGGAKGLFEAGVIHAFHIVGMEFDVITGSSIGAFNSIFFAEYLLRKKQLPPDVLNDSCKTIDAMDSMVKAYHHAWLRLPEKKVIDDSENGPLGKLKDDLLRFNINLPDMVRIIWWWTNPDRRTLPSPGVWPAVLKLGKELYERIGGGGKLLQILKHHPEAPIQHAIRTYLSRFGMEKSLVPPEDDIKLSSVFTENIEPLQPVHLHKDIKSDENLDMEKVALVASDRTLRDYAKAGVDVRLTRANYRTGRLEISAYFSIEDFVQYLKKQAFRLTKTDPEKIPLGSFRLQIPGNPNAIGAALASGRFPGVLAPFPIEGIYPPDDPDNELLHKMLINWLFDDEVEAEMTNAFLDQSSGVDSSSKRWQKTYDEWRNSKSMQNFFPKHHDIYIDGGAIDNTPSNSAIDATREWIETIGKSKRDVTLDLYVIFLNPEPMVEQAEIKDQAFHQVIQRTIEIQGAAKQSSDAVVVKTINTFGSRAEQLGDGLSILLESYKQHLQSLDEKQRKEILKPLQQQVRDSDLPAFLGSNREEIIERMERWAEKIIHQKLPLQVNEVVIYPDEMPMSTLQFTERLGYRQENAINMLTMGCYHALWTILTHLGKDEEHLDKQDHQVLAMTKKWMGIERVPKEGTEQDELRKNWRCHRTNCVFYNGICLRGKSEAS